MDELRPDGRPIGLLVKIYPKLSEAFILEEILGLDRLGLRLHLVSTPISGIPELIDDGEQGLLVPPRDPRALADALHRVLADGELHQKLARAGWARICACFDSRRTTIALRDLFLARIEETTS